MVSAIDRAKRALVKLINEMALLYSVSVSGAIHFVYGMWAIPQFFVFLATVTANFCGSVGSSKTPANTVVCSPGSIVWVFVRVSAHCASFERCTSVVAFRLIWNASILCTLDRLEK